MVRGVEDLEPDNDAVCEAMAEFQESGRLPRDTKTARAVTKWAETGEPPSSDGGSLLERLCIIVGQPKPPPPPRDVVMQGLYEDAVFGDEPEKTLARAMLGILAKVGHDPSKPLWVQLGWEAPAMTCNSMAMTLVGYPTTFVPPQHRRRAKVLAERLLAYATDHIVSRARYDAFLQAGEAFYTIGKLPADHGMADAILWNTELAAYYLLWQSGEDQTRLIHSLREYWRVPAGARSGALTEVRTAVLAEPGPCDPAHPGLRAQLKRLLRPFIATAMEAAEQLA